MNFTLWLETQECLFHVIRESGAGYRVGGHTQASLEWLRGLAGTDAPVVDTGRVSFRFELELNSLELLNLIACLDGTVELPEGDGRTETPSIRERQVYMVA